MVVPLALVVRLVKAAPLPTIPLKAVIPAELTVKA